MSKKHKKVCRILNYIDRSLIVISAITGCIFISAFASLVGIPIGISSYTTGLKTCVITAGIKKYKSIIQKKSHTCEEGGAHLRICLAFIDELEKQLFIKKTVEVGQ